MTNTGATRKFIRKRIEDALLIIKKVTSIQSANKDPALFMFLPSDVSPGGMSIRTTMPLEANATLNIELQFSGETRILQLRGIVRNVTHDPSLKVPYTLGIQWLDVSPEDEVYIGNYIFSKTMIV